MRDWSKGCVEFTVDKLTRFVAEMSGNIYHHINLRFRHTQTAQTLKLADPLLGMVGGDIGGQRHHREDGRG
jgi:hypothetical protein